MDIVDASVVLAVATGFIYFLGISVYASSLMVLGVPVFALNLANCLNFGAFFLAQLAAGVPLNALEGLGSIRANVSHPGVRQRAFLGLLPAMMLGSVAALHVRGAGTTVTRISFCLSIAVLFLLLIHGSLRAFASLLAATNLLIDSTVNDVIAGKEPKGPEWSRLKFDIVRRHVPWHRERYGRLLLRLLGLCTYTLVAWCMAPIVWPSTCATFSAAATLQIALVAVFGWFAVAFFYTLPAAWIPIWLDTGLDRAEVDLASDEEPFRSNAVMPIGEIDTDYLFYVPTEQRVVRISRKRVRSLVFTGKARAFGPRVTFQRLVEPPNGGDRRP